jgi:hypothetical protein
VWAKVWINEVMPHDEIEEIFLWIIKEYKALWIYTKYLNHGYASNRLKTAVELPEHFQRWKALNYYITWLLIDELKYEDSEVLVWFGPMLEWFWRNELLTIWGLSWKEFANRLPEQFYQGFYEKYVWWYDWLDVWFGVQETAHNIPEIRWLAKAFDSIWKELLVSYYLNKEWSIPNPSSSLDLSDWIRLLQSQENIKWFALNCVSRENAEQAFNSLKIASPKLLAQLIWLWTNASPWAYDWDYTQVYEEWLSVYLNRMKTLNPDMQLATWCCGHVWNELCEVLNINHPRKKAA